MTDTVPVATRILYQLRALDRKINALQKVLQEVLEEIFEEKENGTEVSTELEGLDVSDSEESSSSER